MSLPPGTERLHRGDFVPRASPLEEGLQPLRAGLKTQHSARATGYWIAEYLSLSRRPYFIAGWLLTALAGVALVCFPLPPKRYWNLTEQSQFNRLLITDKTKVARPRLSG